MENFYFFLALAKKYCMVPLGLGNCVEGRMHLPLILLFLSFSLLSEENLWLEYRPKLLQDAKNWLAENKIPDTEYESWSQATTRLACPSTGDGRRLQDISYDWFFDNRNSLKAKDPAALKVTCFWILLHDELCIEPSSRILEGFKNEHIR
jgi:hypothetical protein